MSNLSVKHSRLFSPAKLRTKNPLLQRCRRSSVHARNLCDGAYWIRGMEAYL